MMGLRNMVSQPINGTAHERTGYRPEKRSALPPITCSGLISRRLSTIGLAIGYLGLVAILSMAPFLLQAMAPHQGQPLVCTESGGSR